MNKDGVSELFFVVVINLKYLHTMMNRQKLINHLAKYASKLPVWKTFHRSPVDFLIWNGLQEGDIT